MSSKEQPEKPVPSPEELKQFKGSLDNYMSVRKKLDKLNSEAKVCRKFLSDEDRKLSNFISQTKIKCESDGKNIYAINKTSKPKESAIMIYDVIQEIYKNPEMIETIKKRVKEKHIDPKETSVIKLKIVKKRPRKKKTFEE